MSKSRVPTSRGLETSLKRALQNRKISSLTHKALERAIRGGAYERAQIRRYSKADLSLDFFVNELGKENAGVIAVLDGIGFVRITELRAAYPESIKILKSVLARLEREMPSSNLENTESNYVVAEKENHALVTPVDISTDAKPNDTITDTEMVKPFFNIEVKFLKPRRTKYEKVRNNNIHIDGEEWMVICDMIFEDIRDMIYVSVCCIDQENLFDDISKNIVDTERHVIVPLSVCQDNLDFLKWLFQYYDEMVDLLFETCVKVEICRI